MSAERGPGSPNARRSAIRKQLIDRRIQTSRDQRRHWGKLIDQNLEDLLLDVRGRVIGFCWPYRVEHDLRYTVMRLISRGAKAALPVVLGRQSPLVFRLWYPESPMMPGAYGIPIPVHGQEVTPDILMLPMNGFDEQGFRLGYGGGHFDRTLASLRLRPVVIGVAFELGRLRTICPQPHDIQMDYVVTEAGAFRRESGGLRAMALSGTRQDHDRRHG